MASFVKLVYLIIVLTIAIDFISLGNYLFNTDRDVTAVQSSLLLPGAAGWIGAAVKAAKHAFKKAGNAGNKAKKAQGNEHTKNNIRKIPKNNHEEADAVQNSDQNTSKGRKR